MDKVWGFIAPVALHRRGAAVLVAVASAVTFAGATFATGGVYDYSALIVAGSLLTDLALMIIAALTIAVAARFAFLGARFALKALRLIK